MNQNQDQNLSTADFAAAADQRGERPEHEPRAEERRDERREMHGMARDIHETRAEGMREPAPRAEMGAQGMPQGQGTAQEQLAPLFLPQVAENFRSQWSEVQIGFVDDPTQAVKRADELVAQVMKNLAQTFADERSQIEGQLNGADTEHLRVALRRYRSFFTRLLEI